MIQIVAKQTACNRTPEQVYNGLKMAMMENAAPLNEICDSYATDLLQRLSKEKWFRQDIKRAAKEMQRAIRENVRSAHSHLRDIPERQIMGRTIEELRCISEYRSEIYYQYVDICQEKVRKETDRLEQAIREVTIQKEGKAIEPLIGILTMMTMLLVSCDYYEQAMRYAEEQCHVSYFETFICYYAKKAQFYCDRLAYLYQKKIYTPKDDVCMSKQLEHRDAVHKFMSRVMDADTVETCLVEAFKATKSDLPEDMKREVLGYIDKIENEMPELG